MPKALRARPYSIRGFVGIEGERWIPVHGMLPLSRARAAFSALEAVIGSHAADMQATGVQATQAEWESTSSERPFRAQMRAICPEALSAAPS